MSTVTVHVRLRRVQTYLFAVPRLRAMVGANAMLGQVLHGLLPAILSSIGGAPVAPPARLPTAASGDPLSAQDDLPGALAKGILSQDGGHFEATFDCPTKAERFARSAATALRKDYPDLVFSMGPWEEGDGSSSPGRSLPNLPHFQVCQETGSGPATDLIGYAGEPERLVGSGAKRRHEFGGRVRSGGGRDWAGLLQPHLRLAELEAPEDFKHMVGTDYLAVIHADGNQVGRRSQESRDRVHQEVFFHSMRSAVRGALAQAVAETFKSFTGKTRPYSILMLGGDDLLLVCRAPFALRFLVEYARHLGAAKLSDGKPLTIGAGVAISRPTVPFHRLHAIAERLAASAKRLARGPKAPLSAADWAVCSASWWDDPIAARRRDAMNGKLLLTSRPYPILSSGDAGSLESLVAGADGLTQAVEEKRASRSQLRRLVQELARGQWRGRLAWAAVPGDTLASLKGAGIDQPWEEPRGQGWCLSRVPDLVEVFEISRLGRQAGS